MDEDSTPKGNSPPSKSGLILRSAANWRAAPRKQACCSGLMKPDTHLGENARQNEVSDDQTTPYLFR